MGRKGKNIAGGAASGAAAGSAAGPWGALIGGAVGAVAGSQMDTEGNLIAAPVTQDVIDKLYRQSAGLTPTVGELKGAQMYDKTLAAQIAAARASRGTNAGLLQRNVSRIAAEQSQANAQNAAILSAEERNQAMAKYLQAQQMNAQVNALNAKSEDAEDRKADNMLGAGLSSAGSALALGMQKRDATQQQAAQDQKMASDSNTQKDPLKLQTFNAATQSSAPQYGTQSMYQLPDYSLGADLKVTSDERQKDLVKNESLPANNNLQMQTQQAVQPAAAPAQSVAQPAQATPQASAPQQAPAPVPMAPGISAEMLQQAQKSSKRGGNVSDVQNVTNSLQRSAAGPSQDEINRMYVDAKNRETRGLFGEITQSEQDNYAANLQRWHDAAAAQNAAYDKEQGNVDEQNLAKDAQRTARLNRFYTGIDTGSTNAVASQFAPKAQLANTDFGAAQQVYRSTPQVRSPEEEAFLRRQLERDRGGFAGSMYVTSDEEQKTGKKAEGAENFNPKSFLDKLQAYSYEYKNSAKGLPGVDDGRKLGVMAQSLEKAGPVGQSMVKEDPNGNKVVDFGTGFNAILASQAHLNERLKQIESKKKKV